MLDKRTFSALVDNLGSYVGGMEQLEQSLQVTFDDNFLTRHLDRLLNIIAESFFTREQIDNIEDQVAIETVKDIIYHYAFTGEFGLKTGELQRLYVEDEGLKTEEAFNAFNAEELYDIIVRYLQPTRVCTTYTIHC